MKSHSFLLLHILTLIYSWKSIALDAREKWGNRTPTPQLVGLCVCLLCVCVLCVCCVLFCGCVLCLMYVMFVMWRIPS